MSIYEIMFYLEENDSYIKEDVMEYVLSDVVFCVAGDDKNVI